MNLGTDWWNLPLTVESGTSSGGSTTSTSGPIAGQITVARGAPCPTCYTKTGNNGLYASPAYDYCTFTGCPAPTPAPAPAPAPAPVYNINTVSPQIVTSPQISPIFQQQFQPSNSPAVASTTQTAPATQLNPAPAPTPIVAPVQAAIPPSFNLPPPAPESLPASQSSSGGFPFSNITGDPNVSASLDSQTLPVQNQQNLTNYWPWVIAAVAGVILLSGNKQKRGYVR